VDYFQIDNCEASHDDDDDDDDARSIDTKGR
jgi:hypothetical protein